MAVFGREKSNSRKTHKIHTFGKRLKTLNPSYGRINTITTFLLCSICQIMRYSTLFQYCFVQEAVSVLHSSFLYIISGHLYLMIVEFFVYVSLQFIILFLICISNGFIAFVYFFINIQRGQYV